MTYNYTGIEAAAYHTLTHVLPQSASRLKIAQPHFHTGYKEACWGLLRGNLRHCIEMKARSLASTRPFHSILGHSPGGCQNTFCTLQSLTVEIWGCSSSSGILPSACCSR